MASHTSHRPIEGEKIVSKAFLVPVCGASGSASDTSAAEQASSSELRPANGIAGVSRLAHSFANARLGLSQLIHRSNAVHCERREAGPPAIGPVLTLPGAACHCAYCSEVRSPCPCPKLTGSHLVTVRKTGSGTRTLGVRYPVAGYHAQGMCSRNVCSLDSLYMQV